MPITGKFYFKNPNKFLKHCIVMNLNVMKLNPKVENRHNAILMKAHGERQNLDKVLNDILHPVCKVSNELSSKEEERKLRMLLL